MAHKMEKKSNNLNYLYKNVQQCVKDGQSSTLEESVIDGPKGLSIKYYKKKGNDVEKIVIYGKVDSFTMKTQDDQTGKELNKSELQAELKKNKKLKFTEEYVKLHLQKGGSTYTDAESGVIKKASKKSTKKGSKKGSKKMLGGAIKMTSDAKKMSDDAKKMHDAAKKGSKKSSKKSSKNPSKKPSKKSSKKLSKKPSKKSSKKKA